MRVWLPESCFELNLASSRAGKKEGSGISPQHNWTCQPDSGLGGKWTAGDPPFLSPSPLFLRVQVIQDSLARSFQSPSAPGGRRAPGLGCPRAGLRIPQGGDPASCSNCCSSSSSDLLAFNAECRLFLSPPVSCVPHTLTHMHTASPLPPSSPRFCNGAERFTFRKAASAPQTGPLAQSRVCNVAGVAEYVLGELGKKALGSGVLCSQHSWTPVPGLPAPAGSRAPTGPPIRERLRGGPVSLVATPGQRQPLHAASKCHGSGSDQHRRSLPGHPWLTRRQNPLLSPTPRSTVLSPRKVLVPTANTVEQAGVACVT